MPQHNLGNIMPHETSRYKRLHSIWLHLYETSTVSKSVGTGSRSVAARGWRMVGKRSNSGRYRLSFWNDENALQLVVISRTTLWIYLKHTHTHNTSEWHASKGKLYAWELYLNFLNKEKINVNAWFLSSFFLTHIAEIFQEGRFVTAHYLAWLLELRIAFF